jgi:hypothetical protein
MGPHEGVPPNPLSGAAGGNAPFRSLFSSRRSATAPAAPWLCWAAPRSPDGESQSGQTRRRKHPHLPLLTQWAPPLPQAGEGFVRAPRRTPLPLGEEGPAPKVWEVRATLLRISGARRSLPRLATWRNRTRPRHPPGTRWGVRQGRPGAAIPANPVPPSTLSSRKIRQDLSGTQTLGAGGQMGPGYLLTQIPG